MRKYYSLYGRLLHKHALLDAFKHVKRAKGAAGIDGQSLREFELCLHKELDNLLLELQEKRYYPQPVKRVVIPKEDGGERKLGIPTVRDRIVQQALRNILEPIFDPDFHPSSYGYRKGRSCHHAISKASLFIRRYDRDWVVDMDLSKCFDTLDHELILDQFRKKVTDGSVLALLKSFLESGVMIGMQRESTSEGSPQGGVISPLIANVYLDRFDQMMKSRGHRIVRDADDILILCSSESAAGNALKVSTEYLEGELKLTVNTSKTHIAHSAEGIKFLGVEIFKEYTRIQEKKLVSLKAKLKFLTRRNTGNNLSGIISELNPVLRGFVNYFRIANCSRDIEKLMGWIRRRLRHIQLKQWKTPKKLHRRLRQLSFKGRYYHIKMSSWRSSLSPLSNRAMRTAWFHEEMGLYDMSEVDVGIIVLEMR
ncbi:group II intron reverse transcriptase/maturase [uncultured Paraglaciecola sp.]|uniref:group II intron reverse transcriptase/maturase n=1 Tax=uncultured Paraglaciecola sp. TaxID=1765024 RepID=UPI0026291BC7|nr:group II intron reverse transcriptase/maturase [uncultured Paraglaciecola sp.]